MAMFALCAKSTIMLIIFVMAPDTTGGQDYFFDNRCFVAFRTANIFVFSLQLEAGLVVIEVPIFPIARVVTRLATRSQCALMDVLLFMA